ncbi:putative histidine kinase HHK12p [Alternaria alternata]|nr:putative histidine kinase HHK12p [Alternaria alternata]
MRRTDSLAARFFLKNFAEEKNQQLLLSTILDESGTRQGVLAQLLENQNVDRYMPIEGIDELSRQHPGRQVKDKESQQQSKHKSTEQADSMSTSMFQRFAELLPNGLAILDKDAEAIFVNDGFFKLTTNKGNNEFRSWPESIHPDDYEDVMTAYRKAFESRTELQIEFRCDVAEPEEMKSKGEQWRLFLLKPLSEEADAGFISAVIDITDIKQAQLTQEKAANDAKDRKEQQERFIDMVSHEIRNPLSAVLHLAEEVREITKEIGTDHEDIRDQKNGDRNITVSMGASIERPTSYPPNVIYFSEEKEAFHLDSTMTSEWGSGAAMYLMVAVKDTGIGINKEGQAKLFERFRYDALS